MNNDIFEQEALWTDVAGNQSILTPTLNIVKSVKGICAKCKISTVYEGHELYECPNKKKCKTLQCIACCVLKKRGILFSVSCYKCGKIIRKVVD